MALWAIGALNRRMESSMEVSLELTNVTYKEPAPGEHPGKCSQADVELEPSGTT